MSTCCQTALRLMNFSLKPPRAVFLTTSTAIQPAQNGEKSSVPTRVITSDRMNSMLAHSSYDGRQEFLPVQIVGVANYPLERIQFGPTSTFSLHQNETAWFIGDKWTVSDRLTFDLGLRFDRDSITNSVNTAPRAGFVLALTKDGKTLLKGGAGLFYDRVPLNIPAFPHLPTRTIAALNSTGGILGSTEYSNVIPNGLQNPRSEVWNLEVDREVIRNLLIRVGYQQRNTVHGFVLTPNAFGPTGILSLSNRGHDFYREFQITGRYQ